MEVCKARIQWVATFLLTSMLTGCGGGGSSEPTFDSGDLSTSPELSTTIAVPNQMITVTHPSIIKNDVIDVTFRERTANSPGEDAFSTTVKSIAAVNGAVDVAVPPYITLQNGEFSSGSVVISINGSTSSESLMIDEFLKLDSDTDGQITVALLEIASEFHQETLSNLEDMAQNLPDMVDAITAAQNELSAQINRLQDMIDEININGTLTVSGFGSTTTLSLSQLNQLDIWNLHSLVSAKTFVETSAKSTLTAATLQLRDEGPLAHLLRNWEEAKNTLSSSQSHSPEFKQNITDLFETSMRDGEAWGRWALNKGLGMLSLFCSGSASAATGGARHVANAAGIAIASLNTLVSSLQAMELRQNTDDFLNRSRDSFDEKIEFLSQFVRLASQYLSSYGTGIPADFGTLVNVAATLKDLLSDAGVSLCENLGIADRFCGGEGLPIPTVPDWDSVCGYDNSANLAGATAIWSVGDAPPYDGRGIICSDRNGDLWLSHNGVAGGWLLVNSVGNGGPHPGFAGCFSKPAIQLNSGAVIGGDWICPL